MLHTKQIIFALLFLSLGVNAQTDVFDLARYGSLDDFQKAVEKHPELVDTKDQRGSSPLLLACYYGNLDVVEFLIDYGVEVNQITKDGSPLMAAAVKGNNNIAKLLISADANPNVADSNLTTALHYAAMFKNYDLAVMLLEAGANPQLKNNLGQSPKDLALIQNDQRLNIIFNIKE